MVEIVSHKLAIHRAGAGSLRSLDRIRASSSRLTRTLFFRNRLQSLRKDLKARSAFSAAILAGSFSASYSSLMRSAER